MKGILAKASLAVFGMIVASAIGWSLLLSSLDNIKLFPSDSETVSTTQVLSEQTQSVPPQELDPIVTCNISANCGGGTKQMKQSECSRSTCCEVGNGWEMYPSKEECTKAQQAGNTVNNNQIDCWGPDGKQFKTTLK